MPEPVISGIKLTVFGPAFAGALFVNLRRRGRTWFESSVSVLGGTIAGGFFSSSVVHYFEMPESSMGAVGFLFGYVGMAFCDTILDLIKNPERIVALWSKSNDGSNKNIKRSDSPD